MKNQKISLEVIKKLPSQTLLRLISKLKSTLKEDKTVIDIFNKYDIDINEIDIIPMWFADLDVSARTDHGIIYFNYKLLTDGDFFKDYSYGVHEITHFLQQTTGDGPTKNSNDDSYLHNPYEQEGFSNQVEYISNNEGKDTAEKYVDKVLNYHDIDGEEKEELESILLKKVE